MWVPALEISGGRCDLVTVGLRTAKYRRHDDADARSW